MKKKLFVIVMIMMVLSANMISAFALPNENEEVTVLNPDNIQEEKVKNNASEASEVYESNDNERFGEYSESAGGRFKNPSKVSLFATRATTKRNVKYRSLGSTYTVRHNWANKDGTVFPTPYPDGPVYQIKTYENGLVNCIEGGYAFRLDDGSASEPSITDWNDNSRGWNRITYTVHNIGTDNSVENKIYRIAPKYSTGNSTKDWAFKQVAMWQCMPRRYDHAEGQANNGEFFTYFTNASVRREFNTWKAKLLKELNVWDTVPSFAGSAMNIKAGETKTFTDSKGSMQYYNSFNITKNGVTVSHKSGSNSITVKALSNASSPTVSMSKTELSKVGGVKYPDNGAAGTIKYTCSHAQDIKFMRGKVSPVYLSLSFNVECNGKLNLKKNVANDESLVKQNTSQYNLAGAEYSIYSDSSCSKYVGKLTTGTQKKDSYGHLYATSNTVELLQGTYYVKETKAPKGYKKDTVIHKAVVSTGKTSTLIVSERPMFDPLSLTLKKHIPDGLPNTEKYLEGAEYTVKYYPDYYYSETSLSGKTLLKTWVFRTDSDGMFLIDTPWFVRGDSLFKQSDGTVVGLYGTYTFEETKAPAGFIKNSGITIRQIKQGIAPPHIDTENHGDAKNVAAERPDNNIRRKITAVKKISKDNVYSPYGTPTAIFKLEGTDLYGKKITYHKSVTLDNSKLNGDYYIGEVMFGNLPAGNYVLSEIKTSRYNLKSITPNTSNAVRSGTKVNIELVNSIIGKATYENEILRWNDYSDMECLVNRF